MKPFPLHLRTLGYLLAILGATAITARAETIDLASPAVKWEIKPENSPDWKPIRVPAGGWRAQGYHCDAAQYRTSIPVPASAAGKSVRLAFAAVNFGAEVYAGAAPDSLTRVAAHINGWMPFTADVTTLAHPGNLLYLRIDVRGRRKFMHDGKYTVPEGATWFEGLEEGIIRGVSLEVLPRIRVEEMTIQTFTAHAGSPDTVRTLVTVVNNTDHPATAELTTWFVPFYHEKFNYPQATVQTVRLNGGESRTIDFGKRAWPAGPSSYWWPNVPYRPGYKAQLHVLNALLKVNGRLVHTSNQRFGFREFTTRRSIPALSIGPVGYESSLNGTHYELNGVRCNLRGDNQQEADFGTDAYGTKPGFGPPSKQNPGWPKAVDNLLRLNFNVMRIHQIPATPYMLDVCDEQGLMLVEESPLRGSEGGEDFKAGRDNMINMDRELVHRDRNHPATVIWSAANEWSEPIPFVVPAILALDDTRPIIADGVGDFDPRFINMEHYVNGGGLPIKGGTHREDRPYGETEAVWPMDNTWQGFAWMATSVRTRRLWGNCDLRNYVLNNAWSNYVPGESAQTEILEKAVKHMGGNIEIRPALAAPWENPHIRLMQQCYHPLAACDIDFDRVNAHSNGNGDWPVRRPTLKPDTSVKRAVAVFNDEFFGDKLQLRYTVTDSTGKRIAGSANLLTIPPGEFRVTVVEFSTPKTADILSLTLSVWKGGVERFREDAIGFTVTSSDAVPVPDGVYRLLNQSSGLPVGAPATGGQNAEGRHVTQGAATDVPDQHWKVHNLANGEITLTNVTTGLALAAESAHAQDGSPAIIQRPTGDDTQIWKLEEAESGFTLLNKATGKLLDLYGRNPDVGARIVVWQSNGGDNQSWQFVPVKGN